MGPTSYITSTLFLLLLLTHQLEAAPRRQKQQEAGDWYANLQPASLPLTMLANQQVQCEPISIKMCAHMPYELTRMPNFFGDENQIEAKDRALQYGELVASQCSPALLAYVCELLAPVCLPESQREAMRRFDIYPCRSWCRRVRRDCEQQLDQLSQLLFKPTSGRLPPGFACDQLPFESNGGNGTNQGPCHDVSDQAPGLSLQQQQQQQQQIKQSSNYSPYQQYLDTNNPPYITDTSKIDSKYVRPASSAGAQLEEAPPAGFPAQDSKQAEPAAPKQATPATGRPAGGQQTLANHLYGAGQTLVWALTRYSNWLSFATVLLLLAALNSHRLSRLARCRPAGSSKSSSASSSSSRHQLHRAAGQQATKNASYPKLGGSHSASSSSRSLMLIAGAGKQPASHQLVGGDQAAGKLVQEPSQQLLQALNQASNSTLINPHQQPLAGTLGRFGQSGGQQRKYFVSATAAPSTKSPYDERQQLFAGAGTLDSQSSQSNQYDYIQLPGQQQPAAAQLYSNILLSSPSHQVLLFNNNNTNNNTGGPARTCFAQNRSARQAPYLASSMSPYAAPSPSGASGSYLVTEHQRSLQRRQRKQHQLVLDSSLSSGSSGRRPM